MADLKISEMGDASTLGGTEQIPVVQAGTNKKATPAQMKTYVLSTNSVATSVIQDEAVTAAKAATSVFRNAFINASSDDLDAIGSRAVIQFVTGANANAPSATSTDRYLLIATPSQAGVVGLTRRAQLAVKLSGTSAGTIYYREWTGSWSSWSAINTP